jgi:signal transduction histidine kinase/HAMP domain-containing protein
VNQAMPSRRPAASMRGILLRLVLLVLLPMLLLQAGIYTAWYYSHWSQQSIATLDTAREAAATFSAYIQDVCRQEKAIGTELSGRHVYTPEEANLLIASAGRGYPSVAYWCWTDPKGTILASDRGKMIGLNIGKREYFQELCKGREWVVSNLLADRVTDLNMFVVASRIDDSKGKMLGASLAVVDIAGLEKRAVALYHAVGEAITLFDGNGILIYNSQHQHHIFQNWRRLDGLLSEAIDSRKPKLGTLSLPTNTAASASFIVAHVPIPDTGWVAGAHRSMSRAMADVYGGLWIAGGLSLLVAVISGGLAWRLGGTFIGQLRQLQSHAEAIGQGDFDHTAAIAEIRELDELALAFNRMGDEVRTAQESLEMLASFPRLNPNPITEVDLSGQLHYLNPAAERLFPDLGAKGVAHPWLAHFESAAIGLKKNDMQVGVREVIVGNKCFQQTVHYLKGTRRVRLYGQEITDRKRAEEALQNTAQRLTRSNAELEQFAYVASHDLQEPLRVVNGYVQLIERKYKGRLDADADQFFHYIVDGVERMQQLIADLLNYSRVGIRNAPFGPVPLQTVVDRALANLAAVIEETGAQVTQDVLPEVHGDETQLVQLFQNLIGNGIKFHADRAPQIHVSARWNEGRWIISVRDNGIGIEQQYWDKIFEIFQRLHTRQKYAGTGIGLAICKRIVECHGGRIWLESQPGLGSTFFFTLA